MPLVYQQNINGCYKLGVWQIEEPEDFFLESVPLQKTISHPHKRLQHLAGRYLLTQLYEDFPLELIRIADTRKPFLPNEDYHFSISHCGDYAAVIASPSSRVGIDVEDSSEKVLRLMNKFLSEREKRMIEDLSAVKGDAFSPSLLATTFWSIKETLFKWYSLGGVDFRKDLHVMDIDWKDGKMLANCRVQIGSRKELPVYGLLFENRVLTWTAT